MQVNDFSEYERLNETESNYQSVTLSVAALGRWLTRRCSPHMNVWEYGGFKPAGYSTPWNFGRGDMPNGYCVMKQCRGDARHAYKLQTGCDRVNGLWLGEDTMGPFLTNYYLCKLDEIPEQFHFVSLSHDTRVFIQRNEDGTWTVSGQMSERTYHHLQTEITAELSLAN